MKRKSVRVATLDTIFSKCIRERSDWICEYDGCRYCENLSFRYEPGGLHNSHFKGRRKRSTRWFPDNCEAFCMKRHEYMGDNPDEYSDWKRRQFAEWKYDDLVLRANSVVKYTAHDRWEMNRHYKAQLNKMEQQRAMGDMGYLVLSAWD